MSWLLIINLLSTALILLAAMRWGAGPERICAATLFAVTYGDPLYHLLAGRGPVYGSVDIGHLLIDLGTAAVFVGVGLSANRIYPLWLAAFQLVSVISHFAREVTTSFPKLAYGLMAYVPFYITLLILAAGIWMHARRKRRYGPYRSWRTSSNPSRAASPASPPTG